MTYFTDNAFEKMMVQKPQYGQGQNIPAPAVSAKDSPPKKEQKVRKLIIVHEKADHTKQDKEGK